MIGDFLRAQLRSLDMSYNDLSIQLALRGQSFSRQAIGRWANGDASPPLRDKEFRYALSASLGMDVNDFLKQIGYEVSDDERSLEARRAADLVDQFSNEGKVVALEVLGVLEKHFRKNFER